MMNYMQVLPNSPRLRMVLDYPPVVWKYIPQILPLLSSQSEPWFTIKIPVTLVKVNADCYIQGVPGQVGKLQVVI